MEIHVPSSGLAKINSSDVFPTPLAEYKAQDLEPSNCLGLIYHPITSIRSKAGISISPK
jgi:hypothetical protein